MALKLSNPLTWLGPLSLFNVFAPTGLGQVFTGSFQHALGNIDLQTAKALVSSATIIADAGISATDLATKRCCTALLHVTDKFAHSNERLAERFNENNMRMLRTALTDLREHRISLEKLADRLSDDWKAEFREAAWSLSVAHVLGGVMTGLIIVIGSRFEGLVAAFLRAFRWLSGVGELRLIDVSNYITLTGLAWMVVKGLANFWAWVIDTNLRVAKAELNAYIMKREVERPKVRLHYQQEQPWLIPEGFHPFQALIRVVDNTADSTRQFDLRTGSFRVKDAGLYDVKASLFFWSRDGNVGSGWVSIRLFVNEDIRSIAIPVGGGDAPQFGTFVTATVVAEEGDTIHVKALVHSQSSMTTTGSYLQNWLSITEL